MSSGFTMALAMPTTLKCTKAGGNKRLKYAVSAIQGYCEDMEDDHAVVEDMDRETSFFGVYDGHGGPAVARYCANHLHIELLKQPAFHRNLAHAIERTFFRMDVMMRDRNAEKELSKYGGNKHRRKFRKNLCMSSIFPCFIQRPPYEGPLVDGCTACVALIRGNQIIIGNAGDSRCVLSRNGQAVALSTDHKQCLPAERQRIEKARNATVRVRGDAPQIDDGISTSRSIGDLKCKQNISLFPQDQILIAFPEVQSEEITAESEFLVIACNEFWDCMTNQQVVDYVRIYLKAGVELSYICESLLSHYEKHHKGGKNMTVVIIVFKKRNEACPALPPATGQGEGSASHSLLPPSEPPAARTGADEPLASRPRALRTTSEIEL